jgi:hypothetical protein
MSAAEYFSQAIAPSGGVILWGSEPPDGADNFIVRLRLKDGRHTWSSAWFIENGDGEVDYELRYVEDDDLKDAEIVGYCRGPDASSQIAYQLGDPGEGIDS